MLREGVIGTCRIDLASLGINHLLRLNYSRKHDEPPHAAPRLVLSSLGFTRLHDDVETNFHDTWFATDLGTKSS